MRGPRGRPAHAGLRVPARGPCGARRRYRSGARDGDAGRPAITARHVAANRPHGALDRRCPAEHRSLAGSVLALGRIDAAARAFWPRANRHVLWGWKRDAGDASRLVYFSGDLTLDRDVVRLG